MQLQGLSAADLLRFWRDIEFFNPFDLDEVIESSDLVTMVPFNLDPSGTQELQQSFAWAISSSEHGLDPEYIYAHDFYFAPFLKSEVRSKIYERFGPEALESIPEYRAAHGLSCIGRMVIDDKGKLLLGNIKLSTLAWALDRLLNEQSLSLEMFDEYVKTLVSDLLNIPLIATAPKGAMSPTTPTLRRREHPHRGTGLTKAKKTTNWRVKIRHITRDTLLQIPVIKSSAKYTTTTTTRH